MNEILDIIHNTIYQFFDICGDDEEVPISDKDKLLLKVNKAICNNLKALEYEPRKGEWIRISALSEQEDNRYKCSCCGNVIHYKNKMDLYTFNSWCGRCGSDNGRKTEVEL